MSARAFDGNPKARWRRDALHDSKRSLRAFEQRPLLDVQLDESLVISFREFHLLKTSIEAGFSANLVHRFAVAILQLRGGLRGECSRKQPASQAANSKTRRFFRREHEKFNRVSRPESAPLQRANRFEAAKHSNHAVIFAGIRYRINMRTSANGRCRRLTAIPTRKNISNRILLHRKPGFFTA